MGKLQTLLQDIDFELVGRLPNPPLTETTTTATPIRVFRALSPRFAVQTPLRPPLTP